MTASHVDFNLIVKEHLIPNDVCWHNVKEGKVYIYGLLCSEESGFCRLPARVAQATSQGVCSLYTNTAGGRIRFKTNSPYLAIRAVMPNICRFPHMSLTGTSGFDLYQVKNDIQTYIHTFIPPLEMQHGYESLITLRNDKALKAEHDATRAEHADTRALAANDGTRTEHDGTWMEHADALVSAETEYVLNFPLYSDVSELLIGIQKGSSLLPGGKYRNQKPIVFYGSYITQGGCASRPGNCYQNFISRHYNLDYLNLDFSGSGKAEEPVVQYMASLNMSMFVSDYDYNAPDADYLAKTHYRMYQIIRQQQPRLPYIMMCRPNFEKDSLRRRDIIFHTYQQAKADGDTRVFVIDGSSLFQGMDRDTCTVDSIHPNDFGFYRMIDAIGSIIVQNYSEI